VVVDTSILLAVFFNEEHGGWAVDQLQEHRQRLRMSTVNYVEALILIRSRQPHLFEGLRRMIEESTIRLVPPTAQQAEIAAIARLRYPLNLGDCFAYALARDEQCPVLTLDPDFRKTDATVIIPRRV
jgi:ribonuclease VapC